MRVIAGRLRSRKLVAPKGMETRPTSDRLRETLFNVLSDRVSEARFADLYAGSGAVGIEALSRGAASCLFAERETPAIEALRMNLRTLGLGAATTTVVPYGVSRALAEVEKHGPAMDVVFLDPPYEATVEYKTTLEALAAKRYMLLAAGALVVAEHATRTPLEESYGVLVRTRVLEQGDASLSFFEVRSGPQAG